MAEVTRSNPKGWPVSTAAWTKDEARCKWVAL